MFKKVKFYSFFFQFLIVIELFYNKRCNNRYILDL